MSNKTPHKHAQVIKAWADGVDIEYLNSSYLGGVWRLATKPTWDEHIEYRIKPEPKPEVVLYACAYFQASSGIYYMSSKLTDNLTTDDNLKLTFNGETNKLIKAKVI